MKRIITLNVNGVPNEVVVEPDSVLLDVLREKLDYTGAKRGCDGTGECGSCTVIMDGRAIYSCLTLALEAEGREIITIEGLARGGELHPIQRAFIEHGAIQCGFCTPGMVLTAKALLDENPKPTEGEVREALRGNLCRCTGYVKIVQAIMAASESGRPA